MRDRSVNITTFVILQILLSFGHFNFNRKRKQTAVTNIFILYLTFRMLQHTSSEVTVKTVTQKFKKLERGTGD